MKQIAAMMMTAAVAGWFCTSVATAQTSFSTQDPSTLEARLRSVIAKPQLALSPLERALLIVDAMEAAPLRVRYLVSFRRESAPAGLTDSVTIARYNLGPAIRREAMQEYGAGNVAPAAAFGLGPHVEWRFKVILAEGAEATVSEAGRREIGDNDAKTNPCLMVKCLSSGLAPELPGWKAIDVDADPKLPLAYRGVLTQKVAATKGSPADTYEELPPARIAMEMLTQAGLIKREGSVLVWPKPPFDMQLLIDRNLGQDYLYDAVLAHGSERLRCSGGANDGSVFRSCRSAGRNTKAEAKPAEAAKPGGATKPAAAGKPVPAFTCQFFREKNFTGTPFSLKAEKLRGNTAYDDAADLPAGFDNAIQSVRCATGCSFFAHSEQNHDGDEFRPQGAMTLADLADWSGRFRSLGISCRAN